MRVKGAADKDNIAWVHVQEAANPSELCLLSSWLDIAFALIGHANGHPSYEIVHHSVGERLA